jgi:hypothetical protein
MKRTFFIGACLALINLTTLKATTNTDSLFTSDKNLVAEKPTTKSELKTVNLIPNQRLSLQISQDQNYLRVALQKASAETLDWIIMERGGEIVSRVKTDKPIDLIKLSNLHKGDYVLMIKDSEGRLLYQPFAKA